MLNNKLLLLKVLFFLSQLLEDAISFHILATIKYFFLIVPKCIMADEQDTLWREKNSRADNRQHTMISTVIRCSFKGIHGVLRLHTLDSSA